MYKIFVRRIPFNTNANISGTLSFVLFEQLYELTLRVRIIFTKYQRQQTHTSRSNIHYHFKSKDLSIPPRYLLDLPQLYRNSCVLGVPAARTIFPQSYVNGSNVRDFLDTPMKY
jgi:hypothetical protein